MQFVILCHLLPTMRVLSIVLSRSDNVMTISGQRAFVVIM